MGKKKDKKERKRRERERAEAERLAAAAPRAPLTVPARPDPPARPSAPLALEPSGPFPGVTPPAVLRRGPGRAVTGVAAESPGVPVANAAREVVARLSGATLCYGEPVTVEGHTVIPVGKVRARGGMGFGGGAEAAGPGSGSGGMGGGRVSASPLWYIEVTAEGTRFTPISSGRGSGAGAGLALLAGAAAGLAGAALASRRRPAPTGLRRLGRRPGR